MLHWLRMSSGLLYKGGVGEQVFEEYLYFDRRQQKLQLQHVADEHALQLQHAVGAHDERQLQDGNENVILKLVAIRVLWRFVLMEMQQNLSY